MTVSDLRPGDEVTFRGEPYVVDGHIEGGGVSWLYWAHNDPQGRSTHTACVQSSWEVRDGKIIEDRPHGEGQHRPVHLRDTVSGDPTLRRGSYGPATLPWGACNQPRSTPGILESRGPLLRWFLLGLASWALFGAAAMVPLDRFWPDGAAYGAIAFALAYSVLKE